MKKFSLVVRNVKNKKEFDELNKRIQEYDLIKYVFNIGIWCNREARFETWEEQEWSSFDSNMILISESFPTMSFQLSINDECDTFYRKYYRDGKSEICIGEVIYETPKKIKWDSLMKF